MSSLLSVIKNQIFDIKKYYNVFPRFGLGESGEPVLKSDKKENYQI